MSVIGGYPCCASSVEQMLFISMLFINMLSISMPFISMQLRVRRAEFQYVVPPVFP